MVALIYRVFAISRKLSGRITNFFDDLYKALYEGHDLLKPGGFKRIKESGLNIDAFRRMLKAHAYRALLKQKISWSSEEDAISSIQEAVDLCSEDAAISRKFLTDLLSSVPLLVRDGSEIKYIHKSVQEYFAADFIQSSPNALERTNKIVGSVLSSSFANVFNYIYELNPSLGRKVFVLPLAREVVSSGLTNGQASPAETILFSSQIKIAWSRTGADFDRSFFDKNSFSMSVTFPTTLGRCLVARIDSKIFSSMPTQAWHSLTFIHGITNSSDDFEALVPIYSRFDEEQLSEISDVETIEKFITVFGEDIYPSDDDKKFRVIDVQACKAALELDERESKALKAADELL
jgi:hypothetical protein